MLRHFRIWKILSYALVCCATIASSNFASAQNTLININLLNQFGLTRGWYAMAPLQGGQSRVIDVKFHSGELFVLSGSGSVACYDGITGKLNWTVRVGNPRYSYLPLGVGDSVVAIVNGTKLFAIGRKDAKVIDDAPVVSLDPKPAGKSTGPAPLVYKTIPQTGKVIFEEPTRDVSITAPAVTSEAILIPNATKAIDRYDFRPNAESRYIGSMAGNGEALAAPVGNHIGMVWISDRGNIGLSSPTGDKVYVNYPFQSTSKVSPTAVGSGFYVGTDSGKLAFFTGTHVEPEWIASVGAGLLVSPFVVNDRMYIVTRDHRLYSFHAKEGRELWQTRDVSKVLCATATKLYTLDKIGRLTIHDPRNGALLATLPTSKPAFPVVNEHSDQIFLVGHDGVIQEIHETAVPKRTSYYVAVEAAPVVTKPAAKSDAKADEKREEKPAESENPFAPDETPATPAAKPAEKKEDPINIFGDDPK